MVIVVTTRAPSDDLVPVGKLKDFPVGSAKHVVVDGHFFDPGLTIKDPSNKLVPHGMTSPIRLYIVHSAPGELFAFLQRDPHLGCRIGLLSDLPEKVRESYGAGTKVFFVDPCHGESFDFTGHCLGSGCDRGLDRFGLRFAADGSVLVDLRDFRFGPPKNGPSPA